MIEKPIDPGLLAASITTAAKYGASGLKVSVLPAEQHGKLDDAALKIADHGGEYPMVIGSDSFDNRYVVPVYMKAGNEVFYFPEAVVKVNRKRNIVATPVLNGRGTVKEMITEGDLELSLSVAVVSTSTDGDYDGTATRMYDVYPYLGVERMRKLLDTPGRIDIVSDFLRAFDLDGGDFGIVVQSYSVNQDTHQNRQVFEIQALSDYDYKLIIEK